MDPGACALRVNAVAGSNRDRPLLLSAFLAQLRIIRTMIRKDTEPDPQPKWLRPIDPLVAASLPIRIDPRLGVDEETADRRRRGAQPLLTIVTVFVTSNYNNVLAAEVTDDAEHGLHVLVRAATGD